MTKCSGASYKHPSRPTWTTGDVDSRALTVETVQEHPQVLLKRGIVIRILYGIKTCPKVEFFTVQIL